MERQSSPGPADVEYFTEAQAGAWGDTLRAFARFVDIRPGWRVLDVGAGPGLLPRLCLAAGARAAVACDESWGMAQRAAELGRPAAGMRVVAGAALCLPFASAAFDAVLATNLLFLLPNPAAGLAEMARVCAPGGLVACLNPSDAMSVAAAEQFAHERGLAAFARFSLRNYARLAEEHHRLSLAAWELLAAEAGLVGPQSRPFAGGLEVFLRASKPARVAPARPQGRNG